MLNASNPISQRISYPLLNQSKVILNAIQDVNPNIQKLNNAVHSSGAQRALSALKELVGVDTIYKEGGISIKCGDKLVKIFNPEPFVLKVREQEIDNRDHFKYVELKENVVQNSRGFHSRSCSVEEFLDAVFKKLDFPILQLRRFFMRPEVVNVLQKISPKAVLNSEQSEIANDIKTLYSEIQEKIASIPNMATRSKIKNSYSNAAPSTNGSKRLEFTNLGLNNCAYSVNVIKVHSEDHLVINISRKDEEPESIIIDQNNRVYKQKHLGKVYEYVNEAVFYTQQELDSPLFTPKLRLIQEELKKYNLYLNKRISEFNDYKTRYTTGDVGVLDKKTMKLISNIKKMFFECKAKMLKIKDAPRKDAFKKKYKIDTRMSSPSLIFRDINNIGESLHLSFPNMGGVQCMKIILEKQNGNIGKSLFVSDNKLVKFHATSLGRSKRTDLATNYHSQEEIEQSGLMEYLAILEQRLNSISKK